MHGCYFRAGLLLILVCLVSCSDDHPLAPDPRGDVIGPDGGWVTADGVAMLGVPPLVLAEPQEFVLSEATDAPSLPEPYEVLAVVHAGPDGGEFAAPLRLVVFQSVALAWDTPYDLLRHDGAEWQVLQRSIGTLIVDGVIYPEARTSRLGLLAVARNLQPETGNSGSITIYEYAEVGPSGEAQVRLRGFAFFRDSEGNALAPAVVRIDGVEPTWRHLGYNVEFSDGLSDPGSGVPVEVIGGETTADFAGTIAVPAVPFGITSHVGGQEIARDDDLVLEWRGAAPDFVTVYIASGDLRERMDVPNNGRLVIEAATVSRWTEGRSDLKLAIGRRSRQHVPAAGWVAFELNYNEDVAVELALRASR